MKISIAMATYNGARYLREQLDSFVAQTLGPNELVVCDDGSSDDTLEILAEFRAAAPFDVQIHRNAEKLGYAQNFSKALSLCGGDLVFLSDQDDVWLAEKIATLAAMAERDPRGEVFMNDAELAYEDLRPAGLTKLTQIRSAGIPDSEFIMGCCIAVKKSFLEMILPVPETFPSHDRWIVHLAQGLGRRRIVETVLQYYRRHGDNTSMFIANRTERLSRLDYIRSKIFTQMRGQSEPALRSLHDVTSDLLCKVEEMEVEIEGDEQFLVEIERFAEHLKDKKDGVAGRLELLTRPRIMRLTTVWDMLVHGRYDKFQGVRSALLDLVRK